MTCEDCKRRDVCKKLCNKMEKYLQTFGIKSANFIRYGFNSNQRNADYHFQEWYEWEQKVSDK